MQQPSSLIFLAIVVIWAAYLLQHWIRRREALETARTVDQFSDAMRVLERRPRRPELLAEHDSDSTHVSRSSAPRSAHGEPRTSLRAGTVMTGDTQHSRPTAPANDLADRGRSWAAGVGSHAATAHRFAAHAGSPRLRAIALIGSVSVLLITIVCAPFGALPWWSPILMLAVSGAAFYWCRISVAAAHRSGRQRPARPRQSEQAAAGTKNGAPRRSVPLPRRAASSAPAVPMAKATMETAAQPALVVADRSDQVFDVTATTQTPAAPAVAPAPVAPSEPAASAPATPPQPAPAAATDAPAPEPSDAGWQPVAVPPPTYTMKERAPQRRQPEPAKRPSRSYDDVANEDLPFDGLALDQDLDELPSVFRAG